MELRADQGLLWVSVLFVLSGAAPVCCRRVRVIHDEEHPADRQQQRPQEPQRTTTVAAEDDSGPPSRINSQHSPGVLGEERLAAGRQCQPLGSIPRHSHRSKETALHRNLVNQVRALTRKQTEVSVARVSGEAEVASVS
jgi:hypothetical protein